MPRTERTKALAVVSAEKVKNESYVPPNTKFIGGFKDLRERRFAERFIETGLAYQSALDAGYSEATAKNKSSLWVREDGPKQHVFEYIKNHTENVTRSALDRVGITKEMILQELSKLAFASIGDVIDIDKNGLAKVNLSKVDKDKLAAISQLETTEIYEGRGKDRKLKGHEVKVKLSDKRAALQLLGKEAGLFADKVEHSGKDGEPLKVLISPFDAGVG